MDAATAAEALAPPEMLVEYIKFWSLLEDTWKTDEVLVTLLLAVVLFSPDKMATSVKKYVR